MDKQNPQESPLKKEYRNEAYILWQINENLLQNYRLIFITFEAIAITACGFVSSGLSESFNCDLAHIIALGIFLLAGIVVGPIFISCVWMPIVLHRSQKVSFAQWLLGTSINLSPFDLMGLFTDKKKDYRPTILVDENYKKYQEGPTRKKLDERLPIGFIILWVLILTWSICRALGLL
jgi:hypothetical protein